MSWRIATAVLCALAYGAVRHMALLNVGLLLALLGLAALEVAELLVALFRRQVRRSGWSTRAFWFALSATSMLAVLLAWSVLLSTFANDVPVDERHSFDTQVWLLGALAALLRAVPRADLRKLPMARLTLSALLALELAWQGRPLPAAIELTSPFAGPAVVVHGGPSPLTNHHALVSSQAHALDLLSSGQRGLHDCQGEPLLAPVPGRITSVVAHLPDSAPSRPDLSNPAGNHLVIEADPGGSYVLLAHLERGSINVGRGARVRRGDVVARCGNSGNSTQPHLHLQAQNQPQLDLAREDLRTFPIRFVDISLKRGGSLAQGSFSLRRNDVFSPLRAALD